MPTLYMFAVKLGDKLNKLKPTEGEGMELVNIKDAKLLDIHWTGLEMLGKVEEYLRGRC